MSQPSVSTMKKWLFDVMEVERRLIVVDSIQKELSRKYDAAGASKELDQPTINNSYTARKWLFRCGLLLGAGVSLYLLYLDYTGEEGTISDFMSDLPIIDTLLEWPFIGSLLADVTIYLAYVTICLLVGFAFFSIGALLDSRRDKARHAKDMAKFEEKPSRFA